MKNILMFVVFGFLSFLIAGEFTSADVWKSGVVSDGVLKVSPRAIAKKSITVNPKKECRISFEYRALPDGKKGKIRFGFQLFADNGQEIRPYHVIVRSPVLGELAETVNAGALTIKINNAPTWKKYDHYSLAFKAKEDLSDLPNFNTFESYISGFRQENDACVITFKKPIKQSFPAGTKVRSHRYGGEFYPFIGETTTEWQKSEFALKGIADKGSDSNIQYWHPGATSVIPIIHAPEGAEMRGISIRYFENGEAPKLLAQSPKIQNKRPVRPYEKAETQIQPDVKISALYPCGVNGFFLPGEELKFIVSLQSSTPASGELELYDYQGKLLGKKSFVNTGKAQEVIFSAPGTNGYFPVICRAWSGKTLCAESKAGAIVLPVCERRDPWFALNHNGISKYLREGYKRLGIGMLGVGFCAYHVDNYGKGSIEKYLEYLNPRYEWIVNDPEFECYGSVGTSFKDRSVPSNFSKVDLGSGDVGYCIEEDLFPVSGEFLLRTRELAKQVALRYSSKIKEWHVGEEIDASFNTSPPRGGTASGTLTAYILMSKQIYRGLKAGNPKAKIDVLGIAGGDWRTNPQFQLSKIILKDLGKGFDGVFIDAYSGNWNSLLTPATSPEEGNLSGYIRDAALLSASFGRPFSVINGERGYACNYFEAPAGDNGRQLADFTARSLILSKNGPCERFVIFKDMTASFPHRVKKNPNLVESGFWDCDLWRAVLDENGKTVPVPRPMALAVAVAAQKLAFVRPAGKWIPGNGVHVCFFTPEKGGTLAAVWTTDKPVQMRITLPKESKLTDFGGNEKMISGKVTLPVTNSVFYLNSPLGTEEMKKLFKEADFPVSVEATGEGRRIALDRMLIQLVNRTSKPMTGTLRSPDGKSFYLTLPPFGWSSQEIPFPEQAGDALFELADGKKIKVPLNRTFDAALKVKKEPKFDGSGEWLKPLKAIELRSPDNVEPKRALQWELGYFRNDGTDITAKLYPAWDDKNFYLGVEVKDLFHLQRHTSNAIWKDDMLQFAISTRFNSVMPELQATDSRNSFSDFEFNLGLALTPNGVQNYSWSKKLRGATRFSSNVTRKGNITLYEVAIPWSFLGVAPKEKNAIRFSALIMNVDSADQPSAPYRLEYAGGIASKENVSKFNTLVLMEDK